MKENLLLVINNMTTSHISIKILFLHNNRIYIIRETLNIKSINKLFNRIEIEFGFGRTKPQLEISVIGDAEAITSFQNTKYYPLTSTFNTLYKINYFAGFENVHQNRDVFEKTELELILKHYEIKNVIFREKIKYISKQITSLNFERYIKEITLYFGLFMTVNELNKYFKQHKMNPNIPFDIQLRKSFYKDLIENKIKPIVLEDWQSIFFSQNLIKIRFQELYQPVYLNNKSNFLNQLETFPKYEELRKYISTRDEKEQQLYYYDINRSYESILKTKYFRSGDLRLIKSSNLDDYNFMVNCSIYHDPVVLQTICNRFKLNQIDDIYKLSMEDIKSFKQLYPSIYRPYISVKDNKYVLIPNIRPILVKEQKINIWLTKEEINHCLENHYIIEPIEGVNRERFESFQNNFDISKDFSHNFFFKKLYKKSIQKFTGLLRKSSIEIGENKYELSQILSIINNRLVNNMTYYSSISDNNTLIINFKNYKNSFLYNPFFKRIFKNKTILMYYEIISTRRVVIHKKVIESLREGSEVIYSNTDSIITTSKLDSNLLSKNIGSFKEEYRNIDGIYISSINNYIIGRNKRIYSKGDNHELGIFPNRRFRLKRSPIIKNNMIIDSLPYIFQTTKYTKRINLYSHFSRLRRSRKIYNYHVIDLLDNSFKRDLPLSNRSRIKTIRNDNIVLTLPDELIDYYLNHNLNSFSQTIGSINKNYYRYNYFIGRIEVDLRLLLYYDFLNNKKIPESGIRKINQIKEWLNKQPLPIKEFIRSQLTGNKININYIFELKLLLCNNKVQKNDYFLYFLINYNDIAIPIKKRINITTNEELLDYCNQLKN